jgi:hypothetical protein
MVMNSKIKEVSDPEFLHYASLLLTIIISCFFLYFSALMLLYTGLFLLFLGLVAYFYFVNFFKHKRIELYTDQQKIRVGSYYDKADSFFLSLQAINSIEKNFPGRYTLTYYENNFLKTIPFMSCGIDEVPPVFCFDNNKKVNDLIRVINEVKEQNRPY